MRGLKTPCCGASFYPHIGFEGSGFLQREVVDSYICNGKGCYNEWDADGTADEWNKDPDEEEAT